jgi:chromatin segregation and condensation protein Rec8/ScpA/Scc1 (kleisin family)
MSQNAVEQEYIPPEEKIYQIATDKNALDWKSFLYSLIHKEGLNPWDVDIGILTHRYLEALKEVKDVDFNISGKLLTVAVHLLKTKAEILVEKELRGIDEQIQLVENEEFDIETLEEYNDELEQIELQKKKTYKLKVRNPLARKRKVNIFDLIKSLEKTFSQSNNRRRNFLFKNRSVEYEGPTYEKKKKDLKTIIEELFETISKEFEKQKEKVHFHHLTPSKEKIDILNTFIPLLHLHNQNRIEIRQEKHFGTISIHKK